jgi:hypothetical protein
VKKYQVVLGTTPIIVTLMKAALSSSKTLALIRATRCNIPEDAILHSHRHENLKSNILLACYSLANFPLSELETGYVTFEVFMAVTMKYVVFLDVVALVRNNASEECIAFIIRVTRIRELGTELALTSN